MNSHTFQLVGSGVRVSQSIRSVLVPSHEDHRSGNVTPQTVQNAGSRRIADAIAHQGRHISREALVHLGERCVFCLIVSDERLIYVNLASHHWSPQFHESLKLVGILPPSLRSTGAAGVSLHKLEIRWRKLNLCGHHCVSLTTCRRRTTRSIALQFSEQLSTLVRMCVCFRKPSAIHRNFLQKNILRQLLTIFFVVDATFKLTKIN